MHSELHIEKITVYPIKSFDGVDVQRAELRANGSLKGDREFAFFTNEGERVTAKKAVQWREDHLFKIRITYDDEGKMATFNAPNMESETLNLYADADKISAWMSKALGREVTLRQNSECGFPDEETHGGPTIIGSETLKSLGEELGHSDSIGPRLRANIVIGGLQAFGDDQLYSKKGMAVPLKMGNLEILGVRPTGRCVVPSIGPDTGIKDDDFIKKLMTTRKQSVIGNDIAFDRIKPKNFFCAAVNTEAASQQAGCIKVGDSVTMGEPITAPSNAKY